MFRNKQKACALIVISLLACGAASGKSVFQNSASAAPVSSADAAGSAGEITVTTDAPNALSEQAGNMVSNPGPQEVTEENAVWGIEYLAQSVDLYEALTGESLPMPEPQETENGLEERVGILNAAKLGIIDLDELCNYDGYINRQTAYQILYQVMITFDPSLELADDEAEAILNGCHDNAFVHDENRRAYAFMIKYYILNDTYYTDPDGAVSKEEGQAAIQLLADTFRRVYVLNVGEDQIRIGDSKETLLNEMGNPNRISGSEYGFDWYIYNGNYSDFVMVGVANDRVCAFYSNAKSFSFDGICVGMDRSAAADYEGVPYFEFGSTPDGVIDSISYIPYAPAPRELTSEDILEMNAMLRDLMNTYRVKHDRLVYLTDDELTSDAVQNLNGDPGTAVSVQGTDALYIYKCLLNSDQGTVFLQNNASPSLMLTVNTAADAEGTLYSELYARPVMPNLLQSAAGTEEPQQLSFAVQRPALITAPVVTAPAEGEVVSVDENLTIRLDSQVSDKYLIKVYDLENHNYIINEYVTSDRTDFVYESDQFIPGTFYRLCVAAVDDGELYNDRTIVFRYGDALNPVSFILPKDTSYRNGFDILLSSSAYHDFKVTVTDSKGNTVHSEIYRDQNYLNLNGLEEDRYTVIAEALAKDTNTVMGSAVTEVEVKKPEPVITETILSNGDTYEYVYGNAGTEFVYFYDEYILEDTDSQGRITRKKKIVRTQLPSTPETVRLADEARAQAKNQEPTIIRTGAAENAQMQYIQQLAAVRAGAAASGTLSGLTAGASASGQAIASFALQYQGVPYVWGGTTPSGFDCSGLVKYVCNQLGISVHRTSREQFAYDGTAVSKEDLQTGDLVFFQKNGVIHHVGIYLGDGMMIHAPRTGDVVRIASMETEYYQREYAGARRLG